ncbi:MAG: DUF2130 domain-containing protein [Chitinophagaceae bacterium]|nr:DUF2130 domain-containing protein [Chitinophagaceae bacterium]
MATDIKCPKCGFMFPMGEAVSEEYKNELRNKMLEYKKQKDDEVKKHRDELDKKEKTLQDLLLRSEQEYARKLTDERSRIRQHLEEELRKSIGTDFENRIHLLQQVNAQSEEKLKAARQKELEFLLKEQDLLKKEQELQITLQKKLLEERLSLTDQIRKEEVEKIALRETELQLKLKELEKQLDTQKKLADEMKRKAEQGSMQLQGEAQELLLEEILRDNFPFDQVIEVGKGVEGADCILTVRNAAGVEFGKIIFESKRTKTWSNNWIEKLRNDMRSKQADIAVLVTQVYPRNMDSFGEREGIWICSFKEVNGLTAALRTAIIRIAEARQTEENKGEKMQTLYNFLTGLEFRQQMEAIVEGFISLKDSIIREKLQMEKIWREREKQLEKVLINTAGMYGSIKGIAGASVTSIPLLENNSREQELF